MAGVWKGGSATGRAFVGAIVRREAAKQKGVRGREVVAFRTRGNHGAVEVKGITSRPEGGPRVLCPGLSEKINCMA